MIALQPDEQIMAVVHRHWFIFVAQFAAHLVLLVLPFIVYSYLTLTAPDLLPRISEPVLVFMSAAWALAVWMRAFTVWLDYFLDQWIITDRRIIDIEQRGLFSREESFFRMERIQDVTSDVHGVLPTLLNFGDVHVQTAGETSDLILHSASRPQRVKEIILRHSDKRTR